MTILVAAASRHGAAFEIAETTAREHRLVAGKIDTGALGFGERPLTLALRVPEGDVRDPAEITARAQTIAAAAAGDAGARGAG